MTQEFREWEGIMDALHSLEAWDAGSPEEWRQVVKAVLRQHKALEQFADWEQFILGDKAHTFAVFAHSGCRFALLPGYVGELGYDAGRHTLPDQLETACRAYRGPTAFATFVRRELFPKRDVVLSPFLIETTAAPQTHLMSPLLTAGRGREHADQLVEAEAQGFRPPTVNELEYAYTGGTLPFFAWGDTWPPIAWSSQGSRKQNNGRGSMPSGNTDREWLSFAASPRRADERVTLWHQSWQRLVLPLADVP